MALTNKQLFTPAQLGVTLSTFYTTPSNRSTLITRATFTNITSSAVAITAHLVSGGSTALDSNKIISNTVLDSGETFSSPDMEGQIVPSQGTIQMNADTASAITVIFSGIEIT